MAEPKILKYYLEDTSEINNLDLEFDPKGKRPAWIQIKNPDFKARFLSVRTETEAEIIYKRFAGNFYYPLELKIKPLEEERFYQKYAALYDTHVATNNIPMAKFVLSKMFQLSFSKTSQILDLGAGTGIFSDLAVKDGYTQLTLLDKSQAMLEVAKAKPSLQRVKFVISDALEMKLPDLFDAVVSIMMFDVIDDNELAKILNNIHAHLKNNGYLLLVEDKQRLAYKHFFREIESGLFQPEEGKELTKYYFIGQKVSQSG